MVQWSKKCTIDCTVVSFNLVPKNVDAHIRQIRHIIRNSRPSHLRSYLLRAWDLVHVIIRPTSVNCRLGAELPEARGSPD